LEECERRDRKGLYAKARAGEIPDFTGISSPYEAPTEGLKIDTTDRDIADCLAELLDALTTQGWLHR
jgi:sulfate adenylyltransferase